MSDSSNKSKSGYKSVINSPMTEKIKSYMKRDPNNFESMIISGFNYEKPEIVYSREKLTGLIDYKKPVLNEKYDNCTGLIELNKDIACVASIMPNDYENDSAVNSGITAVRRGIQNVVAAGARPVSNVYSFIYAASKSDNTIHDINEFCNAAGTPVIDSNFYFNDKITTAPLLNIITLGTVNRRKKAISSKSEPGESVMLLGHFNSNNQVKGSLYSLIKKRCSQDKNPPLVVYSILEKLFIEGVSELFQTGVISKAFIIEKSGIIGSAANIIRTGKTGVRLDIDKLSGDSDFNGIYKIISGYLPHSILVIINNEKKSQLRNIIEKWLLDYCEIGEIINDYSLKCYMNNKPIADIPGKCLSINESPANIKNINSQNSDFNIPDISIDDINEPGEYRQVAEKLLKQPDIAAKSYTADQYHMTAGSEDISINIPSGTGGFKPVNYNGLITVSINSNSKHVSADYKTGIIIMITRTIKDIICSGSDPLAMSICLNICESDKKEFKEQFELIYDGIEEAIKHFKIPLANFNLSSGTKLKPDKDADNLLILPVIGTIGKLDNNKSYTTRAFKEKGHMIYLIGKSRNDIASSEYIRVIHKIEKSPAPFIDIEFESLLHKSVKGLIKNHLIVSAHSVSEGGLFFTLLESAIIKGYGFDITSPAEIRLDAFLFGESQGRMIVTVSPDRETEFIDYMLQQDFPFSALGHVTKEELRIDDMSYGFIGEYKKLYSSTINEISSLIKK